MLAQREMRKPIKTRVEREPPEGCDLGMPTRRGGSVGESVGRGQWSVCEWVNRRRGGTAAHDAMRLSCACGCTSVKADAGGGIASRGRFLSEQQTVACAEVSRCPLRSTATRTALGSVLKSFELHIRVPLNVTRRPSRIANSLSLSSGSSRQISSKIMRRNWSRARLDLSIVHELSSDSSLSDLRGGRPPLSHSTVDTRPSFMALLT